MKKLLIVGYGDIARRATPSLQVQYEAHALVRSEENLSANIRPIIGDLDDPASLDPLLRDWDAVLHLAPPGDSEERDERTRGLVAAFSAAKILPRKLLYISTSGVYGDCNGEWVDETHALNPQSTRARRRLDAERCLQASKIPLVILRVPGIYAADRLPLARLRKDTPVLRTEDDVYTNHIHADDLAAICTRALELAPADAIYNVSDDSEIKMGDWFDLVADRNGLPRPPRISRAEADQKIPAPLLSFMRESRRLRNRRMKEELAVKLRYSTVYEGVPRLGEAK